MFEALLKQHRERVTEAQLPVAILCHMFASSNGVKDTSPAQFLAYQPPAPESAPADPDLWECDMRAWITAHNKQVARSK